MKNKLLALKLLKQKIHDPSLTFPLISEKTGYSKRQLIRLSHSLDGSMDMEALCHHSNEGKELSLNAGDGFMQGIFLPYGITEDDAADGTRNGGFRLDLSAVLSGWKFL